MFMLENIIENNSEGISIIQHQITLINNSKDNMNKKIRNIIYRICGIGMLSVFIIYLIPIPYEMFHCKVWFVEMIALTFFGISWLTKANCYRWLFADK